MGGRRCNDKLALMNAYSCARCVKYAGLLAEKLSGPLSCNLACCIAGSGRRGGAGNRSFTSTGNVSDLFRGGSGTGFLRTQSHATEQTHTESSSTGAPARDLHDDVPLYRVAVVPKHVDTCWQMSCLPTAHVRSFSARLFLSEKGCKGHFRPDLLKLPERAAAGRPLWLPGTLPELASGTALQLGEYLLYTVFADGATTPAWLRHLSQLPYVTLMCVQNFVALVPLALLLGEVTEDLALRFGDTIGGLLNATFGNA